MTDTFVLKAEKRTEFGKGFARRARMAGRIPAVLYGHGSAPVHITLPGHETKLALKHKNAVLEIDLDGKKELTIAKDVQRDVVKRSIDHIDLLIVKKGETVAVAVPIHVVGEPISGNVAVLDYSTLQITGEATHLPEVIEVSVAGLGDGSHVTAGELKLPAGVALVTDAATTIVTVAATKGAASAAE